MGQQIGKRGYYFRRLHVFGDSFAATKDFLWGTEGNFNTIQITTDPSWRDWDHSKPQDYKEIIAEEMNALIVSDSPYTAVMGASDEWIIKCFKAYHAHISTDDIVLIIPTDPLREYLITMVPLIGSTVNLKEENFYKQTLNQVPAQHVPYVEKQIAAALHYHDYIACDTKKIEALVNQYYARIALFQKMLDRIGCRYLIIPGQADIKYSDTFPHNGNLELADDVEWDTDEMGLNIHNRHVRVKGSLKRVGIGELEDRSQYQFVMNDPKYWCGADKRRNHLSKVNHQILADKIIDSLNTGADLDLSTGFEQGFITTKNCLDPEITIETV